ncbi:MAG: hypothetical protein ABIN15_07540 [candidate division WOR-3 bacterium]
MIFLFFISFYSLNFYFENECSISRESKPVNWEMFFYRNHYELKYFYSREFLNTYTSYMLENTYQGSKLLYLQGHVEVYNPFNLIFFAREDRHFFESPLLFVISPERIRDDDFGAKSEGMRLNLKAFSFSEINYLFSKSKRTENADYNIFSLKFKKFFDTQLLYGHKKNYYENRKEKIYEGFIRFPLLQGFLTFEYSDILKGKAFSSEISNIYLGPFRFVLSYYHIDDSFRTNFSNRFSYWGKEWDRKGFRGEINFFFPYKSITLTERFDSYKTRYLFGTYYEKPFRYTFSQTEIFVEFINGYSFKSFYEIISEKRAKWKHIFFEIKKEEKNYLLKIQYKMKDIGIKDNPYSIGERNLIGLEGKINLPLNFYFYFRGAIANRDFATWESAFLQMGYTISGKEFYAEYGEGYVTDFDLINDNDFADSQYQKIYDIIRIKVKIWF